MNKIKIKGKNTKKKGHRKLCPKLFAVFNFD